MGTYSYPSDTTPCDPPAEPWVRLERLRAWLDETTIRQREEDADRHERFPSSLGPEAEGSIRDRLLGYYFASAVQVFLENMPAHLAIEPELLSDLDTLAALVALSNEDRRR